MGSVRVAIVGVGNCAASLVQGVEYYKDADPTARVPGLMHVQFGDYHVARRRVRRRVRRGRQEGRPATSPTRSCASENNTIKFADVPPTGVTVQRGHTLDGLGKYYRETIDESDEEPVDVVAALRKDRRSTSSSATCPSAPRTPAKFYAQCAIDAGSPSSTRSRSSSPAPRSGRRSSPRPASRSSATTSSPRSARPSRTACWPSCSRTAASILRPHLQLNVGGNMDFMNMLERERLSPRRSPRPRPSPRRSTHELGAERAHRPVGLRAVARRPQVGLRPARGPRVRRRPAEPGVQARGLGLPELGRRHHRRGPRARRSPRTAASAARSCRRSLLHEVPAGAVRRRRGARRGREVHRAARSSARTAPAHQLDRADGPAPCSAESGAAGCSAGARAVTRPRSCPFAGDLRAGPAAAGTSGGCSPPG